MKLFFKRLNSDAIGITASLACAVHCAVLPLFFSALPVFGFEVLHNKIFEYGMIGFAAVVGMYSLYHGLKKHHHNKMPLLVFACGLLFLVLKEIFISFEIILLFPAAFLIIGAHIINFRLSRKVHQQHKVAGRLHLLNQ